MEPGGHSPFKVLIPFKSGQVVKLWPTDMPSAKEVGLTAVLIPFKSGQVVKSQVEPGAAIAP